jgi:hypothetical protein
MKKKVIPFVNLILILIFSDCGINHDNISSQTKEYYINGKKFKPNKHVLRSMAKEKDFMLNYFQVEGIDTFYSIYVSFCDPCKFYSRYYFFYQHNGFQFLKYFYSDPNNWSIIREKPPIPMSIGVASHFFSSNHGNLIDEEINTGISHEILKYEFVWNYSGEIISKKYYSGKIDKSIGDKIDSLAVVIENCVYKDWEGLRKQKNLSKSYYN